MWVMTKVQNRSNIPIMSETKEIRDILRLQDELVRHRAVWDAEPWMELDMSTPQLRLCF